MQKITILLLAVFLRLTTVNASETYDRSHVLFNFDQPISFVERGIEFFIFPNGEFDFNTDPSSSQGMYHRRPAPAVQGPHSGGIIVEHDSFGRIRRIGNVFVNYDFADRIRRIGTVNILYAGQFLTQIGGLRLFYDRRGRLVEMIGEVKRYARPNVYQYQYQDPYVYNHGYNPHEYYYYRADGTKAPIKDKEDPEKEKL